MNLYDNSGIDCNKKNKNIIYDLYNNIVLNKFVHSNKYKIVLYLLFINITNTRQIIYFNCFLSVFRVLLSNK